MNHHLPLPDTVELPPCLAMVVLGRFEAAIDDVAVPAQQWPSLRATHLVQLLAL
jgi:hypothetical protein